MSIEAMKQALEALEMYLKMDTMDEAHILEVDIAPKAITVLRAAIEQSEKPGVNGDAVEWLCERCNCIYPMQRHGLVQPCPHCKLAMKPTSFNLREIDRLQATITALRQWVGLTEEEIENLEGFYDYMSEEEFIKAIRGVEAKLKEKNT